MTISRRAFAFGASSAAAALAAPSVARAQARPRVVVIGGGPAGSTVAKYVARDSAGAIDVVMIDPSDHYMTCFHSNLWLGGLKQPGQITFSRVPIAKYGVKYVKQFAARIDRDRKMVALADGAQVPYDRLVVAPGIDLDYGSVPGWSKAAEEAMPHAWKAGPQTELLIRRIDAVPDGGLIVMIAPPNPYRCPPGPYERVSMMAARLKAAGKSKAKIVIVDPKESFSKQALFQQGWERHYPGMVEWLGPKVHEGVKSVDPKTGEVVTGFETYKADLVNVIPAQMAGAIAREAGLSGTGKFCTIDPANMRSVVDPAISVLGDSSIAGDMPKSAFAANSQAKVVAQALRAELTGARAFPTRYANTCWSLITADDCVKVGGVYAPADGKIAASSTFVSKTDETEQQRHLQTEENLGWYSGFVADVFG